MTTDTTSIAAEYEAIARAAFNTLTFVRTLPGRRLS
jgi:hypothetical protein